VEPSPESLAVIWLTKLFYEGAKKAGQLAGGKKFFSPKLQVRMAASFEALGSSNTAVLTVRKSSQPVRQKRRMRVTVVKTKWSARRTGAVSVQWGRVLWWGRVTLCNCTKVASGRPIIRVMTV
jgi:hypothetical protein